MALSCTISEMKYDIGWKSHFYCAMLWISAVYAVMQCLSVCPSVCLSVCLSVMFVDHIKTNKHIFKFFSQSGSHTILVLPYQTGWRYSDGNPHNGGVECRWGVCRNRDSGLIAGYRRLLDVQSAKNIYRWRSWVYDTVSHAPLAIDRLLDVQTAKWQKQLPTTMQCRSDIRRRTIECLFVTACSMDQYAEEKRTEKNLMVCSGISQAEQLIIKDCWMFCIEAIQTQSIAWPHCNSRASCFSYPVACDTAVRGVPVGVLPPHLVWKS